jgi:hypothetical protein
MAKHGRRFQQLVEEHWIPVVRLGVNNGDAGPHKPEHVCHHVDVLTDICGRDIQSSNKEETVMQWAELGNTIVLKEKDYDEDEESMPLPKVSAQSRVLHPGNRFKYLLAEHFKVSAVQSP